MKPDFKNAALCYERAVMKNNPEAMFGLGVLYLWGNGVNQDTD